MNGMSPCFKGSSHDLMKNNQYQLGFNFPGTIIHEGFDEGQKGILHNIVCNVTVKKMEKVKMIELPKEREYNGRSEEYKLPAKLLPSA